VTAGGLAVTAGGLTVATGGITNTNTPDTYTGALRLTDGTTICKLTSSGGALHADHGFYIDSGGLVVQNTNPGTYDSCLQIYDLTTVCKLASISGVLRSDHGIQIDTGGLTVTAGGLNVITGTVSLPASSVAYTSLNIPDGTIPNEKLVNSVTGALAGGLFNILDASSNITAGATWSTYTIQPVGSFNITLSGTYAPAFTARATEVVSLHIASGTPKVAMVSLGMDDGDTIRGWSIDVTLQNGTGGWFAHVAISTGGVSPSHSRFCPFYLVVF
jgi:hypothetical protein